MHLDEAKEFKSEFLQWFSADVLASLEDPHIRYVFALMPTGTASRSNLAALDQGRAHFCEVTSCFSEKNKEIGEEHWNSTKVKIKVETLQTRGESDELGLLRDFCWLMGVLIPGTGTE